MDVFGELNVELLTVEIEAEQAFIIDGLGADAFYMPEAQIAPIDGEQNFNEFNAMSSFALYDAPQDGLAPPDGDVVFDGALAEWLDAFINADAPTLDAKDDLVAMSVDPSLGAGAINDIIGSMYHKDAHNGPGGLYGPGGEFEASFALFDAVSYSTLGISGMEALSSVDAMPNPLILFGGLAGILGAISAIASGIPHPIARAISMGAGAAAGGMGGTVAVVVVAEELQ